MLKVPEQYLWRWRWRSAYSFLLLCASFSFPSVRLALKWLLFGIEFIEHCAAVKELVPPEVLSGERSVLLMALFFLCASSAFLGVVRPRGSGGG